MKSFTDNLGQKWNLTLNLRDVRKLREPLGLDLFNPTHHLQVLSSLTDRIAFVFFLCESQAKEYEVDIDEFEERLYGEGFANAASDAFLEELADFYQRLGQEDQASLTRRSIRSMQKARSAMEHNRDSGAFSSVLDEAEKQMEDLLQLNGGDGSRS